MSVFSSRKLLLVCLSISRLSISRSADLPLPLASRGGSAWQQPPCLGGTGIMLALTHNERVRAAQPGLALVRTTDHGKL